jgi:hypothetical protein
MKINCKIFNCKEYNLELTIENIYSNKLYMIKNMKIIYKPMGERYQIIVTYINNPAVIFIEQIKNNIKKFWRNLHG